MNADFLVEYVKEPGEPLSEQSLKELKALENLSDEDIDYSDIPPTTEEDWKEAVHGWLPLERHTVSLALDADVFQWIEREGFAIAHTINFALRRELQRQRRLQAQSTESATQRMSKAS